MSRSALLLPGKCCPHADGHRLVRRALGVVADGTTDDGPAIDRLLQRTRTLPGPVTIMFPKDRVIAVETGVRRYVLQLDAYQDLTIDGNGSEFRLSPHLRFLNAFRCRNLTVVNLKVDYRQQPTTPATIVAVHPQAKSLEVRRTIPSWRAILADQLTKMANRHSLA